MSSGVKLDETTLEKCDLCECLILPNSGSSSNNDCYHPPKPLKELKKSKHVCSCNHSIVKINVKGCVDPHVVENIRDFLDSNTDMGAGLCKKKKPSKVKNDGGNQTSQPQLKSAQCSEPNLTELLAKCDVCCQKSGGGGSCCGRCNTNTIIFPHGGGVAAPSGNGDIETFIKGECRTYNKSVEEIMSEISKERKEVREVRDILDSLVQILREVVLRFPENKGKDPFADLTMKNTSLQRKSKATSINKKSFDALELNAEKKPVKPLGLCKINVQKKRRFWPCCK